MNSLLSSNQVLKDHIPPQQGLRPSKQVPFHQEQAQRPYPTTTRIKTLLDVQPHGKKKLKDHIPSQQGLRQPLLPTAGIVLKKNLSHHNKD